MKVFKRDYKINFVDENNVFLGYDLEGQCCENATWFIVDKPLKSYPEFDSEVEGNLDGFVFDQDFQEDVMFVGERPTFDTAYGAMFRITRGKEEKFIYLFNIQNGYYSHGFTFSAGRNGYL